MWIICERGIRARSLPSTFTTYTSRAVVAPGTIVTRSGRIVRSSWTGHPASARRRTGSSDTGTFQT